MKTPALLVSSIACLLLATSSARGDDEVGSPPAPAVIPPPAVAPPPVTPRMGTAPARARIHINGRSGERPSNVFLRSPGTEHHLLCTTPCTTDLTPGDLVRVGHGATPDDPGEDLIVPAAHSTRGEGGKPNAGDSEALVGGTTLVVIGSGGSIGGIVFLASQGKSNGGNPSAAAAGILLLGAGVGILVGGLYWLRGRSRGPSIVAVSKPGDDHARATEASAKPRDPLMPISAASTPLTWAVHF